MVRDIFRLITVEGYGTNKVASQLNLRGIKTKRGTTLWRGTSIRAIIFNPIYKGVLWFGEELSPPIERLRIVSDEEFDCCEALVKGRAPERPEKPVKNGGTVPFVLFLHFHTLRTERERKEPSLRSLHDILMIVNM